MNSQPLAHDPDPGPGHRSTRISRARSGRRNNSPNSVPAAELTARLREERLEREATR